MTISPAANAVNAANQAAVAASTTANSATSAAAGSGSAGTMTQNDFLQLLTAQLKYQTPNNPADPTQLASEFAAISTVNGIDQLNSSVSAIQTNAAAAQMAQAAGLVGKQVAVAGNDLLTDGNGAGQGVFTLGNAAQNVTVTVTDAKGAIAGTLDLGALAAGQQSFSWSGGTANGDYSYSIGATDAQGAAVSVTPYSVYTVQGVNLTGSTPTLNVRGSAAQLPVSSIQTVLGASS